MPNAEYKVLRSPINALEGQMETLIDEGWDLLGPPALMPPYENEVYQALIKGDGGESVSAYKVVRVSLDGASEEIGKEIEDGWKPYGGPLLMAPRDKELYQALVKG